MTGDAATFLLTADGRTITESIAGRTDNPLAAGTLLRKHNPDIEPLFLAAAVELASARIKAKGKFRLANRMFFTREALEQSSGERIARHRAKRFLGLDKVCDACSGIGGDAVALADATGRLTCVDMDDARVAFCRENLAVHGLSAEMINDDISAMKSRLSEFDALFIDPGRRSGGRRTTDLSMMEPPIEVVEELLQLVPRGAVKLSPASQLDALTLPNEIEWISDRGGLKEAVMWTGEFRRGTASVTLLHHGVTLSDSDLPDAEPEVSAAGEYLYEPDPALIRSGLLGRKAAGLGMRLIHHDIAYMTSDDVIDDPFFTGYRILHAIPFNLKRLEKVLRERNVGVLTVKKRGFPMLPEEVIAKLRLDGNESAIVILTREQGRHTAYIVEPLTVT